MTHTAKTIGRRELLGRGASVAALALVGATAANLPLSAKADAEIPVSEPTADAKVMSCGRACLELAKETAGLHAVFLDAVDKQEAALKRSEAPRWCLNSYGGGGQVTPVPGIPKAWQVYGVDIAPGWYALNAGEGRPEHFDNQRWFRLKAKTFAQAKREASALDRKLDHEFLEAHKRAGVPFNRAGHYKNWNDAHRKLSRMANALARLRAATPEGLNIKAMVLAVSREAFDDDMWCEKLQDSLMADIAKNAKAAA